MSTTDELRAHNRGVPLGPQSIAAFEKSKVVTPGGSMRAAASLHRIRPTRSAVMAPG